VVRLSLKDVPLLSPFLLATVGAFGLGIDVIFHWAAACYDEGVCDPVGVLTTLLVDVDPATVPWWVTFIGVMAHTLFIGGFSLLVLNAWVGHRKRPARNRDLARVEELIRFLDRTMRRLQPDPELAAEPHESEHRKYGEGRPYGPLPVQDREGER
jgi:hypothetical protein